MCGALDCPSCGPAQGHEVVRVWDHSRKRYVWRNPGDIVDDEPEPTFCEEGE